MGFLWCEEALPVEWREQQAAFGKRQMTYESISRRRAATGFFCSEEDGDTGMSL